MQRAFDSRVPGVLAGFIKATARTIKAVAEGAAGNILGELATPHVQTLLAFAAGAAGA